MTFWDFLCRFIDKGGLAWTLLVLALMSVVYVLATGSKIDFAKDIANTIYKRNPQDVFEPVETNYKRYTRTAIGSNSICFEINLR